MRTRAAVAAVCVLAWGCGGDDRAAFAVHVPGGLDDGARPAISDLLTDLSRMSGETFVERSLSDSDCRDDEVHVLILGHEHDERGALSNNGLQEQAYRIRETRCGLSGHRIVVEGGSLLAGQWGAYDLLHRLGVRYFHPERTLYPQSIRWPSTAIDVLEHPDVIHRSMHVQRERPAELSAPLSPVAVNMANHQRRWIEWNIKQRQTHVDGYDARFVDGYAYFRGFGRSARLSLLSDENGPAAIDPGDPRPETVQISEAMQTTLEPIDDLPDPTLLELDFAASGLVADDDLATVQRLTYVADYARENYPKVELYATNHGVQQDPTPNYMVRFFDLGEFAPAQLGALVRTLMFYDLDRGAAGVYGNPDFHHLRDWIARQAPVRRIIHAPQSSWWRTFDVSVPLYLAPATLDARQRDLDLLRPHLQSDPAATSGVIGHRLFTGGYEWGYWLIDYCVSRMVWDTGSTSDSCLDDFTAQLSEAAVIRDVIAAVTARQVSDLRDPELLRFLVGSDDDAEARATPYHPLPPRPATVLGWSDQKVSDLASLSLTPLSQMAAVYHGWADDIAATLPMQGEARAPWVREIHDGLRIFALRAEHAVEIYTTVLALRAATAAGDNEAIEAARAGSDRAKLLTEKARSIVVARESDYRYPAELTTAGGEPQTPEALLNEAGYTYRYLSRTHRMYYWVRADQQLAALFPPG